MALDPQSMKKKMEAILIAAFTREFASEAGINTQAAASHKRHAAAISDLALVIVEELLTVAQVAPGIATAGSPSAQVTVAPGKII